MATIWQLLATTSYLREHLLHACVRDGGRVEGVEGDGGALLVPQHEHLVLQADEVDVLVVQLLNLQNLRGTVII